MTLNLESLLPIAFRAVDTARDLILSRPPASVTEKSDRDLVSDVDLAIEQAIRAYLHDATPDVSFLGEEEGGTSTPATGWVWTLDPIDGTSNYAHRIPLCAISLALLHDGCPVLGVIDAPFLGERFHAIEGHGAWSGTRRLAVSKTSQLRDAVVAIGDYAVGRGASRKNETRLAATVQLTSRVHRIRMLGTAALDLAWLADGRLDACLTIDNKPWDVAAGVIIAREAGAAVADADGSPHNLASSATVAAPKHLIDKIIPLIQAADIQEVDSRDRQTWRASPYAALDTVLSRARHLIFEFNGPICDFSAAMPPTTLNQLRAVLPSDADWQPTAAAAAATDPVEIIAHAATISSEVAARADAELTDIELSAAETALPSAYIHETLAACRDSGRTVTVVSRHARHAVSSYLSRCGLADQVQHLSAAGNYPPGHLQTSPHLVEEIIGELGGTPAHFTLITASVVGLDTARKGGIHAIGYATTSEISECLTAAGAACVIRSLADLTLRLRARPMPSSKDPGQ